MPRQLKHWSLWLLLSLLVGVYFWFKPIDFSQASDAYAVDDSSAATAIHVLNRLGYGMRPGDLERVQSMGVEDYIQQQLEPEAIAEPAALTQMLDDLPTLKLSPVDLFLEYGPLCPLPGQPPSQEEIQAAAMITQQPFKEARQARFLRAVNSPRQLQEVMVDFWFNHFNVYARKGFTVLWTGAYERDAIRPHAIGKFRDLLSATARHPAMLFYLDNWLNTAPNSPGVRGTFQGLNENYARELMELHTLGVDGGYTQADVETLTRILTGWGLVGGCEIKNNPSLDVDESGFFFNPDRHDSSDKVLLGTTIRGGGADEVEQALDLLARHPSTARHISYKLAQYFVADNPPSSLVDQLSDRFQETDGDIQAVLNTLFASEEFWSPEYQGNQFKTPLQYVLSVARSTDMVQLEEPDVLLLSGMLYRLGMPLYECRTPDGYAQTQETWLTPDSMLRRVNFATTIAARYAQDKTGDQAVASLSQTLGSLLSSETKTTIESSPVNPKHLRSAMVLGSPDMMLR